MKQYKKMIKFYDVTKRKCKKEIIQIDDKFLIIHTKY